MDLRIDHRTISAEPGLSRVLIVDDNLATLDLTKFVLDAAGFVVESTSDAMNAMSLIATFKPDLILMDIQMPGIDGLETDPAVEGRCSDAAHRRGGIHRFAMKGDEARMRAAGCDGCAISKRRSTNWKQRSAPFGPTGTAMSRAACGCGNAGGYRRFSGRKCR